MTAQTPEIIHIRGKEHSLCEQPLDSYLKKMRKAKRPIFTAPSTACWRGYVGEWRIENQKLYLVALNGWVKEDYEDRDSPRLEYGLTDLFPNKDGQIHAKWYTGELRCPEGALLQYSHNMYASVYERDRLIYIKKGEVISEDLRINPPKPLWYKIYEDGSRTFYGDNYFEIKVQEDPYAPDETPQGYRVWGKKLENTDNDEYFLAGYYRY